MGYVDEILSMMRKGPELASQVDSLKLSSKTIARGAKDSTFQFPCIVSDTVPVDMAYTTAKTLDKVYAAFAQTWLSMNSMFDITLDPTPLAYLKRIHQNLSLESVTPDEGEMEKYLEKVYDGDYKLFMNEDKNFGVLFNVAESGVKKLYEDNKELLREYMSDFDLKPFDTYTEDSSDFINMSDVIDGMQRAKMDEKRIRELQASNARKTPRLTDRDIKRSNDMLPYGIEVRLIAVNDKKEFVQYIDVIIGIKTVLHTMKSEEMVDAIVKTLQNKNVVFKFLRWTTGEISLVKDMILNLDELKMDATNRSNGKAPFISSLKRLKERKFGISNFTVPHKLIPNSTLVLTISDVDYIKDNYAIDLKDARTALKLIDVLFLMGFIYLDDASDIMYAIYDGDRSYQEFSMDMLDRENSANQNRLNKEIGRMLASNR